MGHRLLATYYFQLPSDVNERSAFGCKLGRAAGGVDLRHAALVVELHPDGFRAVRRGLLIGDTGIHGRTAATVCVMSAHSSQIVEHACLAQAVSATSVELQPAGIVLHVAAAIEVAQSAAVVSEAH